MNTQQHEHAQTLLARNGHLTELSMDRYIQHELDEAAQAAVAQHLADCPACAERLEQLQTFDADLLNSPLFTAPLSFAAPTPEDVRPSDHARPPSPKHLAPPEGSPSPERQAHRQATQGSPRRWSRTFRIAAAAAASIAVITIVFLYTIATDPNDPRGGELIDDIRVKGGGETFVLEVHRKDTNGSKAITSETPVHPGDAIGFVLYPKEGGYVVIAGVDKTHAAYPCVSATGPSVAVEPAPRGVALPGAIALDGVLGQERLVAVLCPAPFAFSDIRAAFEAASRAGGELPRLREGCSQQEIALTKTARSGEE